jgi:hypothetical protein
MPLCQSRGQRTKMPERHALNADALKEHGSIEESRKQLKERSLLAVV